MVVQPLQGVVHIAILIDAPVFPSQIFLKHLFRIQKQMLEVSKFLVLPAVKDISLGRFCMPVFDKNFLHNILNIFHTRQRIMIILIQNSHHFL